MKVIKISQLSRMQIVDFLWKEYDSRFRERDFWIRRLEFWWDYNPFFHKKSKMGWVLYDKSICGIICNIPLIQSHKNSVYQLDNLSCWYVKKENRNQSLRLFNHAVNNLENTIIDNTPSKKVEKILKLLKFKNLKREKTKVSFLITLKQLYEKNKLKYFFPKITFNAINFLFIFFNKTFNPIKSKFVFNDFKVNDKILKKTMMWLSNSKAFNYHFLEFKFEKKYSYAIFQERERKGLKFLQLIDYFGHYPTNNKFLIFLKLLEKTIQLKIDMIILSNENSFFPKNYFLIKSVFFRNNQYYLSKDLKFNSNIFHFFIGDKFL